MLRYGMKYVDQGAQFYEAQHRKLQITHLKWKAAKLGFRVVQATNNRASIALRMAASTLRVSNTYLGAQFRRFRTKLGSPIAIKAMAVKLARLVMARVVAFVPTRTALYVHLSSCKFPACGAGQG